jgi:hypothetical protein
MEKGWDSSGKKCPCKKVCFQRKQAEEALLSAKIARALRNSKRRREIRIYLCQCGHYHLSSREDYANVHEVRCPSTDDP